MTTEMYTSCNVVVENAAITVKGCMTMLENMMAPRSWREMPGPPGFKPEEPPGCRLAVIIVSDYNKTETQTPSYIYLQNDRVVLSSNPCMDGTVLVENKMLTVKGLYEALYNAPEHASIAVNDSTSICIFVQHWPALLVISTGV